ncbi:hypothetical protein [Pseudomonas coronafaciens]|uniref:hypothetical protein n=1 Tax=Pseudomonas coronafaciens TaxID=53409 RepID=UPI0006D64740|nr:hypothetical protein [Pseudomonas coronafaciens]
MCPQQAIVRVQASGATLERAIKARGSRQAAAVCVKCAVRRGAVPAPRLPDTFLKIRLNLFLAYGKRKTARILTATPFPVNTPNQPVMGLLSLIYQGCGRFKQTFVLDPHSGVDIMRAIKRRAVSNTPYVSAQRLIKQRPIKTP